MITMRSLTLSLSVMLAGLACQAATLALGDGFSVSYESPPAPELRLKSLDGPEYDLSTMRGRVVVVNFRATWCPPCIEELPTMQRLSQATRTNALDVAPVNVGENAGRIRAFLEGFQPKPTFTILLDSDGEAYQTWGVRGLPKPS